jgi:2'-5' RNA ligase
MAPHVTLMAPDRPLMLPGAAASAFAALDLGLPAFTTRFNTVSIFERRHTSTFVLLPQSRSPLATLFAAVLTHANWQATTASTRRPYEPHITLANQVPGSTAPSLRTDLTDLNLDIEFPCTTIALYQKEASWPQWQELARYKLS